MAIHEDRLKTLKSKNNPPNLGTVYERMKRFYQNSHSEMGELEKLYDLEGGLVSMRLPQGVPMHIPATPANIVDSMIAQLPTDRPVVELTSHTKNEEKNATRLTKWGRDRLKYIKESGEDDVFENVKAHLFVRGGAATKVIVDEKRLPDVPKSADYPDAEDFEEAIKVYEERKAGIEPFVTRSLDPLTVFPSPGNTRELTFVIEQQIRNISDMSEFTNWTDPAGRAMVEMHRPDRAEDPTRQVRWLEFWSAPLVVDGVVEDPGWYIIEVDSEEVLRVHNPYGVVPYTYGFSGLGRKHHSGDPKYESIGLLSKIKGELNAEIRIKTAWDAQWQYHVFPTWLVQANAKLAARQLNKGPGRIIEWGVLGEKPPTLMVVEPPNENMIVFLARIEASMQRYVAPSLAGDDTSEFGILTSIRIGQQLKTIEPVWKNMDLIASRTLNIMAKIAHHRGLSFKVRTGSRETETTLSGDDFTRYDFETTFERVDPAEDQRQLLMGSALREKGDITWKTFASRFARTVIPNPDQEEEDRMVEKVINQIVEQGLLIPSVLRGAEPAEEAVEGLLGGGGLPGVSPVEATTGPGASEARRTAPQQGGGVI